MIPTLERLLYRDTKIPVTRVLVLAPTRELAIQIYEESRKLAQFTDIRISLSTGGLDIKAQEAALRQSPDIVIATPGRLIDHLQNAPSFNLASIEVLVLDEADRMLDEFFLEQMKEVVRLCSRSRQTMLFSATMTENVKDLATVSLTNPVKVFVNENKDIAFNLQQEFIRIRPHMEGDREAIAAALVKRTFCEQCIIFIQTKKEAHRMHLVLGLLGVKVGELHGNLSQAQRLEALKKFKEGEINVLIATDLAARGLDIEGVKTVINLTMPSNIERYIHRVGRTARAGKSGRSVSLSGEKERHVLHEICRRSAKAGRPVLCRTLPQKVIEKYRDRIRDLEKDIEQIEDEEKEEKEMRITELKVNKAKTMLEHREEIMSRPKRTWFQTHSERMQEIATQKLGKFSLLPNKKKKNDKPKQTPTDRVEYELQKAAAFAARSAKRQFKEKRIRAFDDNDKQHQPSKKKKRSAKKSSFDKELTSTSKKSLKHFKGGGSSHDSVKKGGNRSKKPFGSAKRNTNSVKGKHKRR
jgi:ATP-dependent RNA helicase DDX27